MTLDELKKIYKGGHTWLFDRTILLGKSGSHAYGLNIEGSDLDVKGITIPPREFFIGFKEKFEQAEVKAQDGVDLVIYEIRKFFNLASMANPNILEMLWLDESDYIHLSPAGKMLLEARELFLSRLVSQTYTAYAVAQLKRAKSHRHWLLSPPKAEPTRESFGLDAHHAALSRDQRGAYDNLVERNIIQENELSPNFLELLAKEKAYLQARMEWTQYQDWSKNRNPARAELERKMGYDGKNAAHLYRLIVQAKELLTIGKLFVKRKEDREHILSIRNGAWSYDKLVAWAEEQNVEVRTLAETSKLPDKVDRERLDILCVRIVESMIRDSQTT